MNPIRSWLSGDRGPAQLVGDLRSGRAGWPSRLGLTVAAATVCVAGMLFALGMIEVSGRYVSDGMIATAAMITGTLWCAAAAWLWFGFRRWARFLRLVFILLGIWVIVIPSGFLIDSAVRRSELLIAGVVMLGVGLSIVTIVTSLYAGSRGRPVRDTRGQVRVECPSCGYSMVGLTACSCPECGQEFTIDQLIEAQDFAGARSDTPMEADSAAPEPASPAPSPPGLAPAPPGA